MILQLMTIKLHLPCSHSLKDKRTTVKGIISKIQQKFRLSVIESAEQDIHQIAVISLACLGGNRAITDSILDSVLALVEQNEEALIADVVREIR